MNTRTNTARFIQSRLKSPIITAITAITLTLPALSQAKSQLQTIGKLSSNGPRIQLAILLDTSSSMDGLINQTRDQLWQIVNEFAQSKKNGVTPTLEVAVFEYGNSNLTAENGYVRQITRLTRELDKVSGALFSLTTNGGNEYCGFAINQAVTNLQWSQSNDDIKAIFIAGNEPFTQGPIHFKGAILLAKNKGIAINTIHAGNYAEGVASGWQEGALLTAGNYMSIDHNHQVAHIIAPQDKKIAVLNTKLNQTYIPYGAEGQASVARQQVQDEKSNAISLGLLAQRVKSKISSLYSNTNWDLVDAFEADAVKLDELEEEQLPANMRSMSKKEKQAYVKTQSEARKEIQKEMADLSKDRDAYVEDQKRQAGKTDVTTVNKALSTAVRKQGKQKGFVF